MSLNRSLIWLTLVLAAITVVVRPWGDYPVNDDWEHARVVHGLVTTGRFVVDTDMTVSLVLQAYAGAAVAQLVGFSHVHLRLLTIAVAILLLWIVDRILIHAGVSVAVRVLSLALLIGNPIFLHLVFSFMSEVYGYALALAGALVWWGGRARRVDARGMALVTWPASWGAATVIGASFWIRQLCVVVFPALVAAAVVRVALRRDWRGLVRSVPVLLTSTVWFAEMILFHLVWVRASGNVSSVFQLRAGSLGQFNAGVIALSAFELAVYLTLFLFPFLLLENWRATRWPLMLVLIAVGVALVLGARSLQPGYAAFHHHVQFPYSANVVNDANVGPITLTTPYWDPAAPRPRWPAPVGRTVEWLLLAMLVLWTRLVAGRTSQDRLAPLSAEIRDFGLIFAALAFAIYVQAFQRVVLDRYFLPCTIGCLIALAARTAGWPRIDRGGLAVLAVAPLALYAIAGVHDYFRWNDARWAAVPLIEADGGNSSVIDGGYELNGWLNWDTVLANASAHGCRGACGCRENAFYCTDDSYTISTELPPGREVLATLPVDWWLATGPPVVVSRRP